MIVDGIVGSYLKGIPWPLVPAKRLFQNRKIINVGLKEKNRLALTMSGVIRRKLDDLEGLQSSDYSAYQIFEKDDLVFKLIDLENIKTSRVGIVPERGIMSPAYIRLVPASENVYPKFYYWYFFGFYLNNIFNKLGAGIRQNLASGDLLLQPVPELCYQDQMRIAQYIDNNVNRINGLIQEKQGFISLLEEKRRALISHIVTKGLDPNVEMKDSGVEWIGSIPKHWEIKRLRYLGRCQNGINIGGDFFGEGFPFISYGDVYKNRELPNKPSGLVRSSESDRNTYTVQKGDVLFTRTSETIDEIGFSSVCMNDIPDAVFAGFLIRFRPNPGAINKSFSKYYFQNELLRAFFVKEMNLVTRASLSQELLKRMPVVLPPAEEQALISETLDKKCSSLEELMSETKKSIELLKEHKTALISAAVTGKIDLRDKEVA